MTDYYECPTRICVRAIFFLLYINDLPTIIEESQGTMFADYTSLLKSGKNFYYNQILKDYQTGSLVTN